jgi:hypothetical protein
MELWREEIWKYQRTLSEEERVDPTRRASSNDAWRVQFFRAHQDAELQSTEGLIGLPGLGAGQLSQCRPKEGGRRLE